jgi:hypothetical protein
MKRSSIIPCLILSGGVALLAVPAPRSVEGGIRQASKIGSGLVKIDKSENGQPRFFVTNNTDIWRVADARELEIEQPPDEVSLENDLSRELNYDDTWEGYVGAWPRDKGGSQWSVAVTIALSILASAVGYWLFGRSYRI